MLIGIDIGGSAIKMGAVRSDGSVLARRNRRYDPGERFEDLLADLLVACRGLEEDAREPAESIGVCSPGFIDPSTGVLADGGTNVPSLRGKPLAKLISASLDIPAHFANDGIAAAIGEIRFGAGRDFRRLAMLTLGTGVGGCIAIDGEIMTGRSGEPPELGAIVLCDQGRGQAPGQLRSLEDFASAAGFIAAYREAKGHEAVADVRAVFERVPYDLAAAAAVDAVSRRIAQALGSLINALALDGCVIGGGIAAAGDILIDRVRAHLPEFTWPLLLDTMSVVQARRGNDAGFIGAAILAGDAARKIKSHEPMP
jgi:glucokinase